MMSYEKVSQANQIIVGTKQTLKALQNGAVSEMVIADDADARVIDRVKSLALELHVPVTTVDSMQMLGKACGIEVGAATVAIKR